MVDDATVAYDAHQDRPVLAHWCSGVRRPIVITRIAIVITEIAIVFGVITAS